MTIANLLRSRITAIGFVIVLLAGAVTSIALRSDEESTQTSDSAMAPNITAALTVSIVQPTNVVWPEVVTASGAIAPWQEATANAEIGGARITEVLVDVGDQVNAGQLLARFDAAQIKAVLAQQRAALADAEARLVEAVANASRARELDAKHAMSKQDSIKALTAEQTAKAQVDLARARLVAQQLTLSYTHVIAPDDGIISARHATLGMVVAPGTELFRLVRQNRLEWHAELTAAALALVAVGDAAEVALPSGKHLTGTVRQIAPVIDSTTRTGIAFVALNEAEISHAKSGMYAGGNINVGESSGIALPSTTIVQRDGYEYVFLVDEEDGRVAQRKVRTGRRFANRIEILEGVQTSDAIVESGGAFLTDGDHVHIVRRSVEPYTLGSSS